MVVDLIYRVPRIIRADEKLILEHHSDGDLLKRVVGGVTLNHLAWASVLGLRAGIFGKQADDELSASFEMAWIATASNAILRSTARGPRLHRSS